MNIKVHFGLRQLNTLTVNRANAKTDADVLKILNILMVPKAVWSVIAFGEKVKQVSLVNSDRELEILKSFPENDIVALNTEHPDFAYALRDRLTPHTALYVNGSEVRVLSLDEPQVE